MDLPGHMAPLRHRCSCLSGAVPGRDSALRTDGQCLGFVSLSAAFPTEGHWQMCFSYCSFIFFSSVFVLFISLRQLCEFFFFFFCLALLLAYFSPPQIFTAASAAFHCRPRRWCKGAGLLPGKLGELSTGCLSLVLHPSPRPSFHPSPPFHEPRACC